jgi:hypothetical protein
MPKKSSGSSKLKKDELKKPTDTEVDTQQEDEEEKEAEDGDIDLSKVPLDDDAFPAEDDAGFVAGFGEEDDETFDTDEDDEEEEYNGEVE